MLEKTVYSSVAQHVNTSHQVEQTLHSNTTMEGFQTLPQCVSTTEMISCFAVIIFTLNYISLELLSSQFMCTQKNKKGKIIVFLFTFLKGS